MRLLVCILIAGALSVGCKSASVRITKVTQQNSSKELGYYYYLPQNRIIANVVIRKTNYEPGPLAAYAEQYLGYSGILKASSQYTIESIDLKADVEIDPKEVYFITPGKNTGLNLHFAPNGMLLQTGYDSESLPLFTQQTEQVLQQKREQESEKQLSLLTLKEKLDTIYKREILEDSVVVEKRLIERVMIQNTPAESAKEVAQKIVEIRKQKQQLISYSEDIAYPAGTLEVMIAELNQLERQYFKLFLGTTSTERLYYTFTHLPQKENQGFQPLFKFNPLEGINDSLKLIMETVYIVPERKKVVELPEGFEMRSEVIRKNDQPFVYRQPEKVNYKVVWNNKTLTEKELWISQLGTIVSLPVDVLLTHRIHFDSQTGMLRFVHALPNLKR